MLLEFAVSVNLRSTFSPIILSLSFTLSDLLSLLPYPGYMYLLITIIPDISSSFSPSFCVSFSVSLLACLCPFMGILLCLFLCLTPVFELPGGWGVEPPYLILPTPLPLVKIRPRGVEFQPPHLSFAEVGMLLHSHFLLMQSLKSLQCADLNVFSTILIHIED